MRTAGLDIGSRTVKVVLLEGGQMLLSRKAENTFDPIAVCRELLSDLEYDRIAATGYGRRLFASSNDCETLSEIRAVSLGAALIFPACRTVLDIGGQDTKAVSLSEGGRLLRFEMNDRCAAGTGRFLEIMAMALGYPLAAFGEAALTAEKGARIHSLCTVFAESEVVSAIARGADRVEVALGIHQAAIERARSMLERVGVEEELVLAGGVAYNSCIRTLLSKAAGLPLRVPEDPQILSALGAALHAAGLPSRL